MSTPAILRRILWIGAHPDDELFVAPFLGAQSAAGAAIGFLVATRGEQGPCYRAEGARDAGGEAPLRERFTSRIEAFAHDLIVTFDGHNGVPNHADHIAVGRLVTALQQSVPLLLAESRLSWRPPLTITPAVDRAEPFDAKDWWDFLMRDLACHRSQMRPETIEMFAATAQEQRVVWLAPG